jgi:hypothetical protein
MSRWPAIMTSRWPLTGRPDEMSPRLLMYMPPPAEMSRELVGRVDKMSRELEGTVDKMSLGCR